MSSAEPKKGGADAASRPFKKRKPNALVKIAHGSSKQDKLNDADQKLKRPRLLAKSDKKKKQARPDKSLPSASEAIKSAGAGAQAAESIIPVQQDLLSWSRTELPSVAADAGGSTDVGFWETLYASENGRATSQAEEGNSSTALVDLSTAPASVSSSSVKKGKGKKRKFGVESAGAGGIWLGLEELDGVDVKYEDAVGGKKVVFVPVGQKAAKKDKGKGKAKQEAVVKGQQQEVSGDGEQDADAAASLPISEQAVSETEDVNMDPHDPSEEDIEEGIDSGADANVLAEEDMEEVPADTSEAEEEEEPSTEEALASVDWAALSSGTSGTSKAGTSSGAFPSNPKLSAWKSISLHATLKYGLSKSGFTKPTPIQEAAIGVAIEAHSESGSGGSRWRDIVGIAQTGSGKTLAYALPILHRLLTEQESTDGQVEESGGQKSLAALILTPTRELALQVSKSISSLIYACRASDDSLPFATLATVVGGLSAQKQARQLRFKGGADIIVATPGRLWETIQGDDELAERIKVGTRALVIDEADRMMETGHFAEMEQILRILRRSSAQQQGGAAVAGDMGDAQNAEGAFADMQTYIFSATFSATLQVNLKRGNRKALKRAAGTNSLDELMSKIDFRDEDPFVADLSTQTRVAETVRECKIECLGKEKDLYLYYFLLRYPGRTLIFLNSIDGIRRLKPILSNLHITSFPLHSFLQQRQRLKNLDQFRSANISNGRSAVLLATDVAARGLDIPAVDHVIHYQIPRSADTYVHRSGRTGRAGKPGVSLAMAEPAEKKLIHQVMMALKRKDELPALTIEYSLLSQLRERMDLATQIDKVEHNQAKKSHDNAWLKSLADEADLAMDSEDEDALLDADVEQEGGNRAKKQAKSKAGQLKRELDDLLSQPLRVRGISRKYITAGGAGDDLVNDLLQDGHVENMVGIKRTPLHNALDHEGKAKKQKSAKSKAK